MCVRMREEARRAAPLLTQVYLGLCAKLFHSLEPLPGNQAIEGLVGNLSFFILSLSKQQGICLVLEMLHNLNIFP